MRVNLKGVNFKKILIVIVVLAILGTAFLCLQDYKKNEGRLEKIEKKMDAAALEKQIVSLKIRLKAERRAFINKIRSFALRLALIH